MFHLGKEHILLKEGCKIPDTKRGNFPDEHCSDCGELGAIFKHWGPLVPKGEIGLFCGFCWNERQKAHERGETPKPLGVKPPGVPEDFLNKSIKVTTKSGSVYTLSAPNEKGERTVSHEKRELSFSKCKIICLVLGREMYLKPLNSADPDFHGQWTSPVVSIE